MYGGSTADHGRRVVVWEAGDGSVGARTRMRDGRTYCVVGCVGDRVASEELRREALRGMELAIAFDAA